MVSSMDLDMFEHKRRDLGKMLIFYYHPLFLELFSNPLHLICIPKQNGIRKQAQATCLIHDLFVIIRFKNPPIVKKQRFCEIVARFPPGLIGGEPHNIVLRRRDILICKWF